MSIPETVQTFVTAAGRYVERALGVQLDGSEESLAYVDHYIEKTAKAEALLDAEPDHPDLVPLPGGREVTA